MQPSHAPMISHVTQNYFIIPNQFWQNLQHYLPLLLLFYYQFSASWIHLIILVSPFFSFNVLPAFLNQNLCPLRLIEKCVRWGWSSYSSPPLSPASSSSGTSSLSLLKSSRLLQTTTPPTTISKILRPLLLLPTTDSPRSLFLLLSFWFWPWLVNLVSGLPKSSQLY